MHWYRRLFRRARTEKQLDAELRFHLEQQIAEYVATGMTPEEARRRARLEFGGLDQVKEECRDVGAARIIETLIQDVRYGLRQLRRSPGFATVAILTLALGIGANAAIFSLMDSLTLRPLPVRRPQQLVELWVANPQIQIPRGLFSIPMFEELHRHATDFSGLAAWGNPLLAVEANNQTVLGAVETTTPGYFRMIGASPVIGRFFGPSDMTQAGDLNAPAVISYRFWQGHFGGSRAVLGKTIKVQGNSCTVIGVARRDFYGGFVGISADVWIPLGPPLNTPKSPQDQTDQDYWITARLRDGISVQKARAQLETLWPTVLRATVPERITPRQRSEFMAQRLRVVPAETGVLATSLIQFQRPLWILMGAVGLLLLIACVNLANLTLARASSRQHDVGVRLALGCTRGRIAREILIESLLLSVAGALVAFPFALWTSGFLAHFIWTGIVPLALNLSPDWRVFGLAAATATTAGALIGSLPAWHAARQDPSALLQPAGRGKNAPAGRRVFANSLMVAQVAISLVLLNGAALFIRSLARLQAANPGFRTHDLIMLQIQPKPGGLKGFDAARYWHHLIDQVPALPAVRSASLASGFEPLLSPLAWKERVSTNSGASGSAATAPAAIAYVSPGFFHTLGIGLLRGRDFNFRDTSKSPRVAIVSRALSESLFPGGNPPGGSAVGHEISVGQDPKNQDIRVVGIVDDASLHDLSERRPREVYLPMFQQATPLLTAADLQVWTRDNPGAVASQIRQRIDYLGHEYPLWVHFISQQVAKSIARERLLATLGWFFGGLSLLLAAIGLYGMVSYAVAQRTSEIAIRIALGAQRGSVLRLMLQRSVAQALAGIAIGLPAALAASRAVAGMLFEVPPMDAALLAFACVALLAVALLSAYIPARRATRVDPMVALRHE